jgi:acetylornithine deacetylase/succinyl-diaminopimelate desuccinylase-like protein
MSQSTHSPLERQRRIVARVALYGSLALAVALGIGLVAFLHHTAASSLNAAWERVDYAHLPEVQLLQRYVQIDTSARTGSELAGARFLAAQLAAADIPAQIETVGKHAILYARLEGSDPHALVLHNHIDVTDVDPKEWFSPAFEARIELPWMYGRGVFDMKSVAIAELLALADVKRSGRPLRRSVVFLATGDEETGSTFGAQWFIRQHPDLVASFWALLTEGGTVEARTRSDIKYWGTEVGQKHFVDLLVCTSDRTRLDELWRTLRERGHTETDLVLLPIVRQVLSQYAQTRDRADLRGLLAHPDLLTHDVVAFRQLPPYLRSMLRDEVVAFEPKKGEHGDWEMRLKLHLLPGHRFEEARDRLLPAWLLGGLSTVVGEIGPDGPPSPVEHPVFRGIQQIIHRHFPAAPAGPFFLPWTATDARFFRAAGVPSYGFSPFPIMSTDTLQVDKANERLAMPGYVEGVAVYRELLRQLLF